MPDTAQRRTDDQASPLGEWIRVARLEQGISQRELASRSGLSRSYVCDIERGRGAHPSMTTLDKLSAALGLSRVDLLKASGVIEPIEHRRDSEEERRMLAVFRGLSEIVRHSVMHYARFIHTDEHHWVQPNLLDGTDGEPRRHEQTNRHARPLFSLPDD